MLLFSSHPNTFPAMETDPDSRGTAADAYLLLDDLKETAQDMAGWLRFLGIIYIASGVLTLIFIVGALNIWMGVLLIRAARAARSGYDRSVNTALEKLKMFFVVQMMVILIFIALAVFVVMLMGASLIPVPF